MRIRENNPNAIANNYRSPSKSSTPPTASEPSISRSVTPMVVIPVAPRPKKLNAVKKQATPAMTPSRDRSATGLKSFKKVRVQLAEDILKQLLSTLKSEMDKYGPMRECFINWSSTLRQTAGMAKFKKMRPVEIQLSEKVVDDEGNFFPAGNVLKVQDANFS